MSSKVKLSDLPNDLPKVEEYDTKTNFIVDNYKRLMLLKLTTSQIGNLAQTTGKIVRDTIKRHENVNEDKDAKHLEIKRAQEDHLYKTMGRKKLNVLETHSGHGYTTLSHLKRQCVKSMECCEIDPNKYENLMVRVSETRHTRKVNFNLGDSIEIMDDMINYNEKTDGIVVDPYGYDTEHYARMFQVVRKNGFVIVSVPTNGSNQWAPATMLQKFDFFGIRKGGAIHDHDDLIETKFASLAALAGLKLEKVSKVLLQNPDENKAAMIRFAFIVKEAGLSKNGSANSFFDYCEENNLEYMTNSKVKNKI